MTAPAPPQTTPARLQQGRALAEAGRLAEAEAAFRTALAVQADSLEAWFELGAVLHRTGQYSGAEQCFRQVLALQPAHAPAKLMLGAVLADAGRPREAEAPLRQGLNQTTDPRLKAALNTNLGIALRGQRKDAEALAAFEAAHRLAPAMPGLDLHRAIALENLERHDEALALFRAALARQPDNVGLHHHYNDLLYRLGRSEELLASYDRAPQSRALLLDKAFFLAHAKRGEELHGLYRDLLARDPQDRTAAIGAANALSMMGRHREAGAAYDAVLARHGGDPDLYAHAAEPALLAGDPEKALALCRQALALAPHDQAALANMSVALRLMEDARDEALNGYDTLVKVYDLEPPDGFADMESFNAELNQALDRLHPETREFINQSLRGGTQTPDHLFGSGLTLVAALERRINQAVARYVAELAEDERHPLLARKARDFRYAGSWSSRLRDCGFHVNHIHRQGWISSCYYVAVPEAVKDETGRQGWIKFGESSFDVPVKNPVRRAIQPAAGRLVLFPSYTWHGTIPFRDKAARTTIAFDVVPSA